MKPGTKVFIAASSFECSTFEGNGTTEAQLRTCARLSDVQVAPTVIVDGKSVPVAEVETPLLNIVLPADNIFGQPAGTQGLSVGHGWVALLHPLTPGTHTIVIKHRWDPHHDDDRRQARRPACSAPRQARSESTSSS